MLLSTCPAQARWLRAQASQTESKALSHVRGRKRHDAQRSTPGDTIVPDPTKLTLSAPQHRGSILPHRVMGSPVKPARGEYLYISPQADLIGLPMDRSRNGGDGRAARGSIVTFPSTKAARRSPIASRASRRSGSYPPSGGRNMIIATLFLSLPPRGSSPKGRNADRRCGSRKCFSG